MTACRVIADNLSALPYWVFIRLPGGNEPAWASVKSASESCSPNERVFEPLDMRHEFEPSSATPITMALGDKLYIRPLGAPASAAYAQFEVISDANGPVLACAADPTSMYSDVVSLFNTPGFPLAVLAESLKAWQKQGEPFVFTRDLKRVKKVPLVAISAIDPEAGAVTLTLDAAVEAFDSGAASTH